MRILAARGRCGTLVGAGGAELPLQSVAHSGRGERERAHRRVGQHGELTCDHGGGEGHPVHGHRRAPGVALRVVVVRGGGGRGVFAAAVVVRSQAAHNLLLR